MSNIDFSKVITAQEKATQAAQMRAAALKKECENEIKGILDDNTVKNMFGAKMLGNLTADEETVFAAGQAWVMNMILECRRAVADGDDPVWPAVPDGLIALAEKY